MKIFEKHASFSPRRGQTLVETMVSLSVLTVGFLGLFGLLTQSIGLNRSIADSYKATYLATEGIEVVKNILDTNVIQRNKGYGTIWNQGIPTDGTPFRVQYDSIAADTGDVDEPICFDPAARLYAYDACTEATPFRRKIEIYERDIDASGDIDELRVIATVSWSGRGGGQEIVLEDYFYDWNR